MDKELDDVLKMKEIKSPKDEFDECLEVAQSNFADMLHDWERNQKYRDGLKVAIDRIHQRGLKANVLDIGTGTGLLSMFAVQLGADSVTACDGFEASARIAEKLLAANGMAGKVKVINKLSTELRVGVDMDERANILVTEVFDTELIGEGAIQTFNHAVENLLTADSIVVPDKAVIYVQLVESALVSSWNTLKLLVNSEGEVLLKPPKVLLDCPGDTAVHDIQLSQIPRGSFRPLTNPVQVFEFNFREVTPKNRHEIKNVPCISTGLAQAVFMWWELKMDIDHKISLSCAPFWAHPELDKYAQNCEPQNSIPWRDHWLQAIYYLPQGNNLVGEGRDLTIHGHHDEFSLWFEAVQDTAPRGVRSVSQSGLHTFVSRTRIGQLNENLRNKKLVSALENLDLKDGDVLSISQSCSLVGLAAATFKPKALTVVEPQKQLHSLLNAYIQTNKLNNVRILSVLDETINHFTHIIAEPFFSKALLPWDNFEFFQFIFNNQIKSKVTPIKAKILSMPVKFLHLHKIDAPLGADCEGFNMQIYDNFIEKASQATDPTIEAHPLWEYPCTAQGAVAEIVEINAEQLQANYTSQGVFNTEDCNAVVFWVDWQLFDSDKAWISTGPTFAPEIGKIIQWNMYNRQGVRFTRKMKTLNWSLLYDTASNEMKISF